MDQALYQFEPLNSPLFATTGLSVIVACVSIATLLLLLRSKKMEKNYKHLLSMLLFFVIIIAVGIGIFNWFTGERIGCVAIYADEMDTPYGKIKLQEVEDVLITIHQKQSPLTPGVTQYKKKRLVIVLKNGKDFSFSEDNYPIEEMINPMRKVLKEYGKNNVEN